MLGIRVEFDKTSVRQASKELNKETKKGVSQGMNQGTGAIAGVLAGSELADKGKGGKGKDGGGAFKGAAIGGLIGALLGALKPIKELLSVIGGIMQIFMVPVMILMKPFLVLFLKVGMLLYRMFTGGGGVAQGEALATGRGLQTGEEVEGTAGAGIAGLKERFFTWLDNLFAVQFDSLFEATIGAFLKVFVSGLGNIFFGLFDILGGLWDIIAGIFTMDLGQIAQGIVKIFTGIFDVFLGVLKLVVGLAGIIGTLIGETLVILWDGMKMLGGIGVWMFEGLKTVLSASFEILKGIGSWIWDKITGFFGGGGGKETSVNDALIKSNGDIVKFNPNDNIMAFQDFDTLAAQGSSRGAGNITINVEGFVGDEDTLADKISEALNRSARGSTATF